MMNEGTKIASKYLLYNDTKMTPELLSIRIGNNYRTYA
jgi:hypothetical protein